MGNERKIRGPRSSFCEPLVAKNRLVQRRGGVCFRPRGGRDRLRRRSRVELDDEDKKVTVSMRDEEDLKQEVKQEVDEEEDEYGVVGFSEEDIRELKEVFSLDTFLPLDVQTTSEAVLFRGNFRTEYNLALDKIERSLERKCAGKNYVVCLVESEFDSNAHPLVMIYRSRVRGSDEQNTYTCVLAAFSVYVLLTSLIADSPIDDLDGAIALSICSIIVIILACSHLTQRFVAKRLGITLGYPILVPLPTQSGILSFTQVRRYISLSGPEKTYWIDVAKKACSFV